MKSKLLLIALCALLASSAFAFGQQATVAYTFVCNGKKTGPCPQGANPNSLIQASDGNFYGTAANSGTKAGGFTLFGGTVFSLTSAGKFTLLHTFTAGPKNNFRNGADPVSLTEGPDGKLYGLTAEGGIDFVVNQFDGYGVLFRVNKNGSGFQVLHKFCSVELFVCLDGSEPLGPLVVGGDGNIYGTTFEGGDKVCLCGEIFRITPSTGAFDVVLPFTSVSRGGFPTAMVGAGDGSLYGLSQAGLSHYIPATGTFGAAALPFDFPTGCPGLACLATPQFAFGPNGNFYGFYTVYGAPGDSGLYEVQPDGGDFQLFSLFTTVTGGGAGLLSASDGNFWSPRSVGSNADGDILKLSPSDGSLLQTLTPFSATVSNPVEILEAADGTLWGVGGGSGTVSGSGHFSGGTVFSLNVGLPPR
jgi:hypothetical protein